MRVSGRKLRLAVGTGITALMLTVGVSSVGATAPEAVGGTNVIVVGKDASAIPSNNPTQTAAIYRDAVRISRGTGASDLDGCLFRTVGDPNNALTKTMVRAGNFCDGSVIIQPSAYPLWEEQNVPPSGKFQVEPVPAPNTLVVPPTTNPRNGTPPGKTYVIDTFR